MEELIEVGFFAGDLRRRLAVADQWSILSRGVVREEGAARKRKRRDQSRHEPNHSHTTFRITIFTKR
jgi:hypothetical protein